jgi:hypothetical protein
VGSDLDRDLSPDYVRSQARAAGDDVSAGLRFASAIGARLPLPGGGQTWQRWSVLAAAAEGDLSAARILEAHSDALAILAEAGQPAAAGTWGVFAAESPRQRLAASGDADAVTLRGTKPWCSLGGVLDHALVTAHVGASRGLYAVDLQHPTVRAEAPEVWVARGLANVTSGPVHFADTPALGVGAPGWYLERDGFAWGGIGVAACWYGGTVALHRTLVRAAAKRSDELAHMHVGRTAVAVHAAMTTLAAAAAQIDAGHADGAVGALLALHVRSVAVDAAELVLREVGHALGPAPLAFDDEHARRVADLELYIRQHHAERDLATLGAEVVKRGDEL